MFLAVGNLRLGGRTSLALSLRSLGLNLPSPSWAPSSPPPPTKHTTFPSFCTFAYQSVAVEQLMRKLTPLQKALLPHKP